MPKKKIKKIKKVKRSVKKIKKVVKKPATKKRKTEKPVGEVIHYYKKISVGVIKVKSPIAIGDKIKIKGATTDFEQRIDSMQIEHEKISKAKKGDVIGLKVKDKVRMGDLVYLI